MNKSVFIFLVTAVLAIVFTTGAKAQITVTVTNPANTAPNLSATYPSLASALTALNSVTAMTGPVILTLGAGTSEFAPPKGLMIGSASLNAVLSATNNVKIVADGGNVSLSAGTGTATPGSANPDGILKITGADYITIDGLNLIDGNSTNPESMEFGIGIFKLNSSDGAQHNTIKNCYVSITTVNNASGTAPMVDGSVCILMINSTPTAATTNLVPTTAAGSNSSNKFQSNFTRGGNNGFALTGYAAASPFTAADFENEIGGDSASLGNWIADFGGGGAVNPSAGIITLAQYTLHVSHNTLNNNTGLNTNHATTLRGIYLNTAISASEIIAFNTITLKSGGTTSAMIAIENAAGSTAAENSVYIGDNIITACTYTTATSGAFTGILNTASSEYLSIWRNSISNNATNATSGTTNLIMSTGAVKSIASIYRNTLGSLTFNSATSGTLNGINCTGVSPSAFLEISINDFQNITYVSTSSADNNYITFSHATSTESKISENTFTNLNVKTTGTVTFIRRAGNMTSTGICKVINNSIVTGFTRIAAFGTVTFYNSNSSSINGSLCLDTNNNFSNVTISGMSVIGGWSNTEGASSSNGPSKTISGNKFTNITGGAGSAYGINIDYSGAPVICSRNLISGISTGTTMTGINIGPSNNVSGNNTFSHNRVFNLRCSFAAGIVTGISFATSGTQTFCFNNIIGDLKNPTGSSYSSPPADAVRGIGVTSATASSVIKLYNNTIYLNCDSGGTNFSTSGIFHTTNATSTTAALDLVNNIVINLSVATGSGRASAYRRSSTTLTNFSSTSNRNNYYAGGPRPSHLIFYDGTNSDQTIGAYKTRVYPAETESFSENTTFKSTISTNADYMKIDSTVSTRCESYAYEVSGITDDNFGIPRYPYTGYPNNPSYSAIGPDIGANEFGGIPSDASAPSINFTPLINTNSFANRVLTASIIDYPGVPTTGIFQPRIYYKKNAGAYFSSQGIKTAGSGANGLWDFTIITADMGGVTVNDVISYFVIAQDVAGPNITSNPTTGLAAVNVNSVTTPPSSPYTYTIAGPPLSGDFTVGTTLFRAVTGLDIRFKTGIRKVRRIIPAGNDKSLSSGKEKNQGNSKIHLFGGKYEPGESNIMETDSVYSVPMLNGNEYKGSLYHEFTQTEKIKLNITDNILGVYATITAAVADVNLKGVGAANCRFLLTDGAYNSGTGENFPIIINSATQLPTTSSNLIIKPNTGVITTIGDSSSYAVFISRAPFVVIDGTAENSTGSRDLTVVNSSSGSGNFVIGLFNNYAPYKADHNTIKNCNIKGGMISVSTNPIVGILFSPVGGDYDSCLIDKNYITSVRTGIQIAGESIATSDNITVSNNTIGSTADALSCFYQGVLLSNSDNTIITANEIIGHAAGDTVNGATGIPTLNHCGIAMTSGTTNTKIRKNKIHDFYYSGTISGYGAFGVAYNDSGNNTGITDISNNVIYNIQGDGSDEAYSEAYMGFLPQGICIYANGTSAIQIYYNSVCMSGATLGSVYYGSSACLGISGTVGAGTMDVRNNIFQNSMTPAAGSNPINNETMCIWVPSAVSNNIFSSIDYNDYYCNGNFPQVGYFSSYRQTLSDWKTATGKDADSYSGNPGFISTTNLLPDPSNINCWNVNGKGTQLSAITYDINGNTRSASVPGGPTDFGAYEFTPTANVPVTTPSGAPLAGSTTSYYQSGRLIMDIRWLSSPEPTGRLNENNPGSKSAAETDNIPSTVNIKYYSGITPPDTATGVMKKTGKGFWYVQYNTAVDSSNITFYYGMQELGNIPDETDLILAKYDSSSKVWVPFEKYTGGDSTGKSVVNTALKTIHVRQGQAGNASGVYALTSNSNPLKRLRFNISAIMSGYWYDHGFGNIQMSDTINVTLRDTLSPFTSYGTFKVVLDTMGNGYSLTTVPNTGKWYYAQINHLNSIETWTKIWSMPRTTGRAVYDMTSAQNKAYGDNLVQVSGKWCLISGDVNQDGYIDGSDYLDIINTYDTGEHLAGDTNGDFYIDGSDYLEVINHYDMGSVIPTTPLQKRTKLTLVREMKEIKKAVELKKTDAKKKNKD